MFCSGRGLWGLILFPPDATVSKQHGHYLASGAALLPSVLRLSRGTLTPLTYLTMRAVQASRKLMAMGHERTGILALARPSAWGHLGRVPSLLGFPFLTLKAKGVQLDGDVPYDLLRL